MTGVELWVAMWALWSITIWYQTCFWFPARRAIGGCTHDRGRIKACCPDPRRGGAPQDLVWFCAACGFQVPLKLHRIAATLDTPEPHSLWCHTHDADGR